MRDLPRNLFLITAVLVTSLVAGCATSNAPTQTTEDLATILQTERSLGAPEAEQCLVPTNLVGEPHTVLNTMKFKRPIRVVYPGTVLTGDQVTNRLNFKLDKKGVIRAITCG